MYNSHKGWQLKLIILENYSHFHKIQTHNISTHVDVTMQSTIAYQNFFVKMKWKYLIKWWYENCGEPFHKHE